MSRILLTAFEPYREWTENSSWLTLIELTRWFDTKGQIVTRRYPVHLEGLKERLNDDLSNGFEYAVHVGQSPGSPAIKLETTGINALDSGLSIVDNGPAAYRSVMPLETWANRLVGEGIPTILSHHAGTYMCNATLYLSHHLSVAKGMRTQSCFVHLPLAPQQVAKRLPDNAPLPSMSLPMMAGALAILLAEMLQRETA